MRKQLTSILVFFCFSVFIINSYAEVNKQNITEYKQLLLLVGSVNQEAGSLLTELTNKLKKKENIDAVLNRVIYMQEVYRKLIEKCQNCDVPQNFKKIHKLNMKSLKLEYKGFIVLESALKSNSAEDMELALKYFDQSQEFFDDFKIAVEEALYTKPDALANPSHKIRNYK